MPVGEDQVAHVEITREIARRFNHLYGREPDFEIKVENAIKQLGGRNSTMYKQLRKKFQENGDQLALDKARQLVETNNRLTVADRERLLGYLEGGSVSILPEPQVLLTATPKVPGLDGRKMSKSYGNTIGLREDPDEVAKKLKTMQTDPARVRRTDPGDPDKCPVFDLHKIYSTRRRATGPPMAAARPASAASNARSRSSTRWSRRSPASASARRNSRKIPSWCVISWPRVARRRAKPRVPRSTKCGAS